MPNWCVGTLKVRGEKENIRKFVKEGFELPPGINQLIAAKMNNEELPESRPPEIAEDSYSISVRGTDLYIKGTRRMFVSVGFEWVIDSDILVISDVHAAWAIDVDGLTKLSEQYQLDFKIYAFEQGVQFNQDIEIHRGEIIKNDEITFTDYTWECIEPNLGG